MEQVIENLTKQLEQMRLENEKTNQILQRITENTNEYENEEQYYSEVTNEKRDKFNKRNISWEIDRLVPFDGKAENLGNFIKNIRTIREEYPNNDKIILRFLPKQLKGDAALAFASTTSNYENVESFIEDLKMRYSGLEDSDLLQQQLRCLKQKENESVSEYGDRTEIIERRLKAMHEASMRLTEVEKRDKIKEISEKAYKSFIYGLRTVPEHRVLLEKPNSLLEAIGIAKKIEAEQKFFNNASPIYSIYNIKSKQEKKEENLENLAELMIELLGNCNATNIRKTSTEQIIEKTNNSFCNYCKIKGHDMRDCRKLKWAVDSGRINSNLITSERIYNERKQFNRKYNNDRYYDNKYYDNNYRNDNYTRNYNQNKNYNYENNNRKPAREYKSTDNYLKQIQKINIQSQEKRTKDKKEENDDEIKHCQTCKCKICRQQKNERRAFQTKRKGDKC